MITEAKNVARRSVPLLAAVLAVSSAFAHPGSGIVVDPAGQVFFVDTGLGVWKVDLRGRMVRHRGEAFHWMTIDRRGRFEQRHMPRGTGGELPIVGADPTLILSSDFPVAIGSDGAFYYPQPEGADRVRMMRVAPSGSPEVFGTLPPAMEVGPDGKARSVPWIHGLAAGPMVPSITPRWRPSGGSRATARSRSWPATSRSPIVSALRRPGRNGWGPRCGAST